MNKRPRCAGCDTPIRPEDYRFWDGEDWCVLCYEVVSGEREEQPSDVIESAIDTTFEG